jgi:hypothetical protein
MESTPQQVAEGKAVVTVLAAVLERLVKSNGHTAATNSTTSGPNAEVTKFHALKAPGISIKQYLERIHKYASCSTECFVLALIYIDRLIQNNNFILSELNVHRVVITAILLAAKFFDDAYYNNAYYAKVGGVLVSEMNGLEVEFLFRINFSLHVKPDVFVKYQDELVSHAVGAGFEQQMQPAIPVQQVHAPQQVEQQKQQTQQQQVFQPVYFEEVTQQQTIILQNPVGNVTPSPPQIMDYTQQQQPPQEMYPVQDHQPLHHPNVQSRGYPQQEVPLHSKQEVPSYSSRHNPSQQQQQIPSQKTVDYPHRQQIKQSSPKKAYQIQSNNILISPTKDVIFATICPYGGRLNPNSSSPRIFNTATKIYQ